MAIRDEYGYAKKTIEIGDWDMDTALSKIVNHGLSATEWKTIRRIEVVIRDDADTSYHPLDRFFSAATPDMDGGVTVFNSTQIIMQRKTGGNFDTVNFDATGYNRGWITFEYIVD